MERKTEVLYFGVRNTTYPRNERVRNYLTNNLNANVTVVTAEQGGSRVRRYFKQFHAAMRQPRKYDLVILAEFSLSFFPFSWFAAKVNGAYHVVDFFVGLHETEVGDAGVTAAHSLRARVLSWIDLHAIRSADICFTDTSVRARRFSEFSGGSVPFVPLPVGAPQWARDGSFSVEASARTRVLYYGSYLSLHGLKFLVRAFSASDAQTFSVEMIGNGPERAEIERMVSSRGLSAVFSFHDEMTPAELAIRIGQADILVGVFGESTKAAEVIPNKVWQALSMSKTVVTRQSPALAEIESLVGRSLIQLPTNDPSDIRAGMETARSTMRESALDSKQTAQSLEQFVNQRFDEAFSSPPLVGVFAP